ncbi:hypothetical protein BGAL_0029g00130 [Botrytis galanthina]|uniref:Transmembrane protein n=1 Tax=Botrytis galanthina TaxID=278940 RepID=A0A4S8RI37_9HELO|nr:hypothetical protein BGAL_0029g00130 [Botrytis galanthina]
MATDHRSRTRNSMEGSMCAGHMKEETSRKGLLVGTMGHFMGILFTMYVPKEKKQGNMSKWMRTRTLAMSLGNEKPKLKPRSNN